MSAMDLVLGVYERDKHLQEIVLIPSSEINQEPRMEVWTAGRNPNCDLVIQHPSIHGFHFELEVDKVSRRVWVTNLMLMGKLSVAEIVIRPQCTEQFYPGDILKSYDSKHQVPYVDSSAPQAMQRLCEKIIETIDRVQAKWKQDEIATSSTVEHDTTAMKEPLLPWSFTPQCIVKHKEGGNGPKHSSMGSQKGHTRIIQEDNLLRVWGQAQSKEGGSGTCLILAPLRTAEGQAESSRAEPTSGVSSSWARRLPPDRLMSLLSGEVSLDRESSEQQAAAWRTAKDGCKPKE
ncbi:hypothetical protein EJ110_NYTH20563 [Nymphaea thermarum]|nr:hypothetical protein EJ110_NYTH20563 [Nymphaea thermarum]